VAQQWVAPRGVGVVVAMSLQLEQQQIGERVARIPGMRDIDAFGLPGARALGDRSAQQAIVLDVIDDLEQTDRDDTLTNEIDDPQPPCSAGDLGHHEHTQQRVAAGGEVPADEFAA